MGKPVFKDAAKIGEKGLPIAAEILRAGYGKMPDVIADVYRQKTAGDFQSFSKTGKAVYTEVKTERNTKSGSLFLETFSNKSNQTPGWMYNLKSTDLLIYIFLELDKTFVIRFSRLQKWFSMNLESLKERKQNAYNQKNDSWGRLLPFERLEETGALIKELHPSDFGYVWDTNKNKWSMKP